MTVALHPTIPPAATVCSRSSLDSSGKGSLFPVRASGKLLGNGSPAPAPAATRCSRAAAGTGGDPFAEMDERHSVGGRNHRRHPRDHRPDDPCAASAREGNRSSPCDSQSEAGGERAARVRIPIRKVPRRLHPSGGPRSGSYEADPWNLLFESILPAVDRNP